jgi:hypothetical protein
MKNLNITSLVAVSILVLAFAGKSMASDHWVQVSSPNVGSSDNVLAAVAANSASDIWAVGQFAPDSNPNITQTLALHFNGHGWMVVPSPNVGTLANALFSVAVKPGRAWAVGYFIDDTSTQRSLIEVWDGTQWSIVDHPQVGAADMLSAVTAISPSDIWAVGTRTDGNGKFKTLIEHFDGTNWSMVPSPNPGTTGNQLYAVHAISSTSVWAVGQRLGTSGPDRALIEHWNGTCWSVVTSPLDGASSTVLYGVSGVTDDDVRAAGDAQDNVHQARALTEDGENGSFSLDHAVSVGAGENHLYAISSLSNDVAWAVGSVLEVASGNALTLIERGGDSGWTQEASPSPGAANGDSKLGGVAVINGTDVWAVGTFDGPNAAQTLILHCCK